MPIKLLQPINWVGASADLKKEPQLLYIITQIIEEDTKNHKKPCNLWSFLSSSNLHGLKKEVDLKMKIKDVLGQQNATLENVEVITKEEPRQFEKYGKQLKVCNARIKDDTGELKLTLWNDEIDQVSKGDKISIIDGWVKEFNGELQISAGKNGKLAKAGAETPTKDTQ